MSLVISLGPILLWSSAMRETFLVPDAPREGKLTLASKLGQYNISSFNFENVMKIVSAKMTMNDYEVKGDDRKEE